MLIKTAGLSVVYDSALCIGGGGEDNVPYVCEGLVGSILELV